MILIVERDEGIRHCLADIIEAMGFEADCVDTADHAVEYLRTKTPEIVLADTYDGNGIEALVHNCNGTNPKPKFILMGAISPKKLEEIARQFGVNCYLTKPFELEQLESAILH